MDCVLHKSWHQEAFYFKPQLPWMTVGTGNICCPASRLVVIACLQAMEVPSPVPPLPGALELVPAARSEGSWAHCSISCSLQWECMLSGHSLTHDNLDFSPKDWRTLRTAHTILSRDCFMQITFAHTSSVVLGPQSIQSCPWSPIYPELSSIIAHSLLAQYIYFHTNQNEGEGESFVPQSDWWLWYCSGRCGFEFPSSPRFPAPWVNALTMDHGIKGDNWEPVWSCWIAASPGWTEVIPNFTKARRVRLRLCLSLVVLGCCFGWMPFWGACVTQGA